LGDIGIILALGLLLAVGFSISRLARLFHLPGIIGYIVAGIAFGPLGLGLIGPGLPGYHLEVFTHIALMLVAFGIGERFDLRELRSSARSLVRVSAAEILMTFLLVATGLGFTAYLAGLGGEVSGLREITAIALICAAIAVATAPASTIAVMRELGARGSLSNLVLSDVVVNNAMSVILFGMMAAAAQILLGTGGEVGVIRVLSPLSSSVLSLALGIGVGLSSDYIVHRLTGRDDVLVVALATVLLVGGLAAAFGLSSLLAGVAAGFAVVNRDRRDVRAFRALNDFEPPIYGIFFALAGAELRLEGLVTAGLLGVVFVVTRAAGKYFGARLGGHAAGMSSLRSGSVGLSLLPQAGLAVGLAYLVRQNAALAPIQTVVIDLVMASVLINELVGAPLVRFAMLRAGEAAESAQTGLGEDKHRLEVIGPETGDRIGPAPWPQKSLEPPGTMSGHVLINISQPATVRALTRLGTLICHHYGASPMALHVGRIKEDDYWGTAADEAAVELFSTAADEAKILGYKLHTEVETGRGLAEGILRTAGDHEARAIIMGHFKETSQQSSEVIQNLAESAGCPVIVARFIGPLAGGRILVPCTDTEDLDIVRPVVRALGVVSRHTITLLRLMPPETREDELKRAEEQIHQLCIAQPMAGELNIRTVATESRTHKILEASERHDLLIMAIRHKGRLHQAFFGSLAREVADNVDRTVLFVYGEPVSCVPGEESASP